MVCRGYIPQFNVSLVKAINAFSFSLFVLWISGCAHLPFSFRQMPSDHGSARQSDHRNQTEAVNAVNSEAPKSIAKEQTSKSPQINPLRSEAGADSITQATFEDPANNDPWAEGNQDDNSTTTVPPELVEPINAWVDQPERLPKSGNEIAGGDQLSDRGQARAAIADTAVGYLEHGPAYRPRNMHQPAQSATEYALTLQREKEKLLDKISQMEVQRRQVEKKLQAEIDAHTATRTELETSNQIVARLSYENQKLTADNTRWAQQYAQLEKRYRDYTRGVEQSLDEMLIQAMAKQSGGN